MADISQIVYDTIRISTPEFIRLTFAGMAGGLLGAYINDRQTRQRDKESGVDKDRKPLVIAIDEMIDNIRGMDNPEFIVNYLHRLYAPYSAFRYHVKGERLTDYNKAWDTIRGTTHEELMGSRGQMPYDKGDKELHALQQIIISRLEALKTIAKQV